MAMRPISELTNQAHGGAQALAQQYPNQDLVLLEPFERQRAYDRTSTPHPNP